MFLLPPITTFHLALQSLLYSLGSTFSLHFTPHCYFYFPDRSSPCLLKIIQTLENLSHRFLRLSSGNSLTLRLSPLTANLRGEERRADILCSTDILFERDFLFSVTVQSKLHQKMPKRKRSNSPNENSRVFTASKVTK